MTFIYLCILWVTQLVVCFYCDILWLHIAFINMMMIIMLNILFAGGQYGIVCLGFLWNGLRCYWLLILINLDQNHLAFLVKEKYYLWVFARLCAVNNSCWNRCIFQYIGGNQCGSKSGYYSHYEIFCTCTGKWVEFLRWSMVRLGNYILLYNPNASDLFLY